MKKLAIIVCVALAGLVSVAEPARAAQCGLPDAKPLWIDFADGSVPFWDTFAQPGVVSAAANFIYPPRIRGAGGKTVYWDMYLNSRRVGTPTAPANPAEVVERAHRLFDYAAASSACARPWIAENELFGANLPTPWSTSNARYRANVLLYLQTLASRGARPFLLISSAPYTLGEAGDWWRQVAQVADIVREVYFPATTIAKQGPIQGSRTLRMAFRRGIVDFTDLGIPVSKLGIMLGFHTEAGTGGREGLKPAEAWFRTVKWQALAARQVAAELRFSTVWSWGWATWGERGVDPDKPAAACVWLWARNASLCNGPRAAGPRFDASLSEGQLSFPAGVTCTVGGQGVTSAAIAALTRVVGDRQLARSALFARAVESGKTSVPTGEILAAERMIIDARFGGRLSSYRAALVRAGASVVLARSVIGDELRRAKVRKRLRVPSASASQVADYHALYGGTLARFVEATPAPSWLGGRKRGFALSEVAPPAVFAVATGRKAALRWFDGKYHVRPLAASRPLSLVPLAAARPAIEAALTALARENAYDAWAVTQQRLALRQTICRRDELPEVSDGDLTEYLPFLMLR